MSNEAKSSAVRRPMTDLRVQLIVRALDRATASPYAATSGCAESVASMIMTCGAICEEFMGWPMESVRAIVLAYAEHAPDDYLDDMAKQAIEQHAWMEWWDAEGCEDANRAAS